MGCTRVDGWVGNGRRKGESRSAAGHWPVEGRAGRRRKAPSPYPPPRWGEGTCWEKLCTDPCRESCCTLPFLARGEGRICLSGVYNIGYGAGESSGNDLSLPPPDDMCHQTTGRPATQPPDSDDMCPHRQRPPDDRRQQANGRPCSAGRGAAKFTPIYSGPCIFYGVFTSDLRYSRRILGVFCRNSAGFRANFGPKMDEIGVICGRAANFVTSVNRRTVCRAVLS